MDFSKLRTGELVAAVGGLVLLVAMFAFDWYEISGFGGLIEQFGEAVGVDTGIKAWDGQGFFGTIANLVILAAAVAAITLAILTATSRNVALPVAASAITAGLGIGAVVMVLLRMVFQPGPERGRGPALRDRAGAGRRRDRRVRRVAGHAGGGHDVRRCARPAANLDGDFGRASAQTRSQPSGPPRDEPPPEPSDTPEPESVARPAAHLAIATIQSRPLFR